MVHEDRPDHRQLARAPRVRTRTSRRPAPAWSALRRSSASSPPRSCTRAHLELHHPAHGDRAGQGGGGEQGGGEPAAHIVTAGAHLGVAAASPGDREAGHGEQQRDTWPGPPPGRCRRSLPVLREEQADRRHDQRATHVASDLDEQALRRGRPPRASSAPVTTRCASSRRSESTRPADTRASTTAGTRAVVLAHVLSVPPRPVCAPEVAGSSCESRTSPRARPRLPPAGARVHDSERAPPGNDPGRGSWLPACSAGWLAGWRWRRDLNPRWTCAHKRFRGVLLRPLGHATADEGTGARPAA